MRLVIQGKELEFRVQERRITTCSVFHKGVEIASDLAIHAPQDTYDQREGEKIAVSRAAAILFERQQQERKEAMQKVDQVFSEVGALSGSVELPGLEPVAEITEKVMAKLDDRRIKKAKTLSVVQSLQGILDQFHKNFPSLESALRPIHPFQRRPHFGLPFGVSTKPKGF